MLKIISVSAISIAKLCKTLTQVNVVGIFIQSKVRTVSATYLNTPQTNSVNI